MIKELASNPKQLFLIDGIGATVSAVMLGIVLVQLESMFGIPKSVLYFLAALPCFFAIYDCFCYRNINNTKNIGFYLKIIAVVNLLYCCLSLGLAFYHYETIKMLGWLYIVGEILIVMVLVSIEWRVANTIN